MNHEHIQKLVTYSKSHKDDMCSTTYKVNALFEYIEKDLEGEISKRMNSLAYFDEADLWLILESIVDAL